MTVTVAQLIERLGQFGPERTIQLGTLLAVRMPDGSVTSEVTLFAPVTGVAERGADLVLIVADEGQIAQLGDVTPIS